MTETYTAEDTRRLLEGVTLLSNAPGTADSITLSSNNLAPLEPYGARDTDSAESGFPTT